MSNIEKTVLPGGIVSLRIKGDWSEELEYALESSHFDRLEIGNGVIGGFLKLQRFQNKIRWIWNSAVRESRGLENLTEIERIDSFDVIPEPPFDYRLLQKLKSFSCSNAERIPEEFLNHPCLERLDLGYFKPANLSCFSNSKNLRSLRLSNSGLKNLQGIGRLPSLREIRLINSRPLKDISELRHAGNLEILELDKTQNISGIESICPLEKLRLLFLETSKAKQHDLS